MNKSFGIRFVLATMMALTVAVSGCKESSDQPPPGGSGGDGGTGGMAGMGGMAGEGGTGGMAALSVSADPTTTTFGAQGAITTATIDVMLTASGEGSDTAIIYYTTDATEVEPPGAGGAGGAGGGGGAGGAGGMPASSTMEYAGPITVDATTIVKFLAVVDGGATTPQQVEGYTLTDNAVEAQWAESGHGAILEEPWRHWDEDGEVQTSCAKCHSEGGFLQYAENGTVADPAELPLGLDCAACHGTAFNPLTIYAEPLVYPEIQDVVFPSNLTADLGNSSNICMTCHQGRNSTVQVDTATPNDVVQAPMDYDSYDFINIHYFAAAATFFGTDVKGGYEYATETYVGQNMFPAAHTSLNDCIECHMNADDANLKNHTFTPTVADCGPCHSGATFPELTPAISTNYDDIQALLPELLTAIQAYANAGTPGLAQASPVVYDPIAYPYWFNDNGMGAADINFGNRYRDFDFDLLKAAYNYQTGEKDPGGYIHNGAYIKQLLIDSIVDLGGTPSVSRPPTP